jgi:HD superfamily phosphohydrolase
MTQALAASLVHDLGHGPFSHAFEDVGERLGLKMANHEYVSDVLIRDSEVADELRALGSGFPGDVADIISGRGQHTIYSAVVSSQFDADRLDYMRRDRLMTGTQQSEIDFEWLMANLEVGAISYGVVEDSVGEVQTFVLGPKAIYAAEGFVLGLFQLYPTVYFHKATRGAEKIYTELLARVFTLVRDGSVPNTGLSETHPLVKFARTPDNVGCALALDDTVIWGALSLMADAADPSLAELAIRLRDRKLYKCVDVRVRLAQAKGDAAAIAPEGDRACTEIKKKLTDWSSSPAFEAPRILLDEESRSPYKRVAETNGPLDQINMRTDGGHLVDLANRSKVVAEIEAFKLFRVYHAEEDEQAKSAIDSIVEEGIRAWPQ